MFSCENLEKAGFFIWDDFLTSAELELIRTDYFTLLNSGQFQRAGIGKNSDYHINDTVRNDQTYWLEPLALTSAQKILLNKLELLKNEINENLFLGLWNLEGHYSCYPAGGKYQAHLDRFSNDDTRTISMVLYLNQDWKADDGGELRIHHQQTELPPLDIAPLGGRLVCFLSADVLHEVLPTKKERYGFSGWWKRRDPK
jgi:SM-20-related protein